MRTFLATCGIDGRTAALARLTRIVSERRPDAVLFAGGLLQPQTWNLDTPENGIERRHFEMTLMQAFFGAVAADHNFVAIIPGPDDGPLRQFLRTGMHLRGRHPGIRLVHETIAVDRDTVVCGIGGELTSNEDNAEPVIRCSRTTAEYFLQSFLAAEQSQKVLLFASPPRGVLGGPGGSAIVRELIDTCSPRLCVTAGETDYHGYEQVARTLIVNPGRLADGSAAWIDLTREAPHQVQMLNLTRREEVRRTKSECSRKEVPSC